MKYLFADLEYAVSGHALYSFYFLSRTSHMINLMTWTIFAGVTKIYDSCWLLFAFLLCHLENSAQSL